MPFPRFTPHAGLVVDDAFGTSAAGDQHKVDALKVLEFCNPAAAGGAVPSAPQFEAYLIHLSRTVPPQPRFTASVHTIQNRFGTLKLKAVRVHSLLVPSAAALGAGGAPPLAGPTPDHFKCYKVTVAHAPTGQPPFPTFTPTTVTLSDQVGGLLHLTLTKPTKLCLPADKNG